MAHVVPQWSVLKTPSAMQPSQLGEELVATPVRNGPGVALGSRTRAGTWIGTKKLKLQETQTLIDTDDIHALMDMHFNHTSGDLNTPDIKLEDFTFDGTHEEPIHNDSMEVSSTSWNQDGDYFMGEQHGPPSDGTVYFDSSPGELQGDLEKRVCLTKYTMDKDTDGDALQPTPVSTSGLLDTLASTTESTDPCSAVSLPTSATHFQINETDFGHNPSTHGQQHHSSIPVASTSDTDFQIPADILDQIDNLLPDSLIWGDNEVDTSTELDMMIGQQAPDLLLGAIQNSGLSHELDNLVESQIVKGESQSEWSFVTKEDPVPKDASALLSSPSTASLNRRAFVVPGSPSKPGQPSLSLPTVPSLKPDSTVLSGSRPRRTSKKPVRFEDHGDDASENMDTDFLEEPVASTSSYTVTGRRSRQSLQNLSEKEKYHRIRHLNNEASKRCRQKRKLKMKDIEAEESELLERNEELKRQLALVEKQRDRMKKLINLMFMVAKK
ncbi:uncharacterized protein LOC119593698 isoform X1 [Penaeus monodon]|uniref:uncharacterized protein LOC119593698 isoform X1 n=2 Tax=Penaeus monodon TaxID=6687 RepID=UPI0018A74D58|nr:uncharacterized protein LOC119593698 isoform X1 [Penaeus monodon]